MRFEDAFVGIPTAGGAATMLPPELVSGWAQHLRDCGFVHVSEVAALAVDGVVEVGALPPQRIKYQPAARGPRSRWNNAGRWVPMSEPDPPPVVLPDISELQPNERQAMLEQFRAAGMIPATPTAPTVAGEL